MAEKLVKSNRIVADYKLSNINEIISALIKNSHVGYNDFGQSWSNHPGGFAGHLVRHLVTGSEDVISGYLCSRYSAVVFTASFNSIDDSVSSLKIYTIQSS